MSNFAGAVTLENEIVKATDFQFAHDQQYKNIGLALKTIVAGEGHNFILGGSVEPYTNGGMNVQVEGLLAYEDSTESVGIETEMTKPISLEAADDTLDRIDIVQASIEESGYDEQSRAFIDPDTSVKNYEQVNTKKKVVLNISVKKGSAGAEIAPAVDEGCVKLAEITVPAGTINITSDLIENVSSRVAGGENLNWTADKKATFSPMYLASLLKSYLSQHNEDGTHKTNAILASMLKFGTESDNINASLLPVGESLTLNKTKYESVESTKNIVKAIVNFCNDIYAYANNIFSRYSYISDIPVVASTENIDVTTGGEMTIDGVSVTAGQMVFLKDQTDKIENGFWIVQTGSWNRASGYLATSTAFDHKFVYAKSGTENAGKIFYLPGDTYIVGEDDLDFVETNFTPNKSARKFVVRDENGRAKVAAPEEDDDIARYYEIHRELARNSGTNGVGFAFGKERFLTFAFADSNHKSVKIKADTHIRLDIVSDGSTEKRWFDVDTDTVYDLSEGMQTAADASATRTGQLNGRDFYLYLAPDGTGVKMVVSCNSTFPNDISADYTANNTRKIGQFATLCADAGSNLAGLIAASPSTETAGDSYLVKQYNTNDEDGFYDFYNKKIKSVKSGTYYDVLTVEHPLAGFKAGDILPESVFCLSFRPYSEPAGMVYDVDTDMAYDIYLQSGKGRLTASVYGGTITDTRPQQNHQDDMRQVRKRLLFDNEFASMASGSNEATNISGSTDPGTTGGHNDTASRRMTSFIGVEDACGVMWQWSENVSANGYGANSTNGTYYWPNHNTNDEWETYDGQGDFGKQYGISAALLLGGGWGNAASCGSRGRRANSARSSADADIGGRGASRVLRRA